MNDPPVRPDGRCVVCGGERRFQGLSRLYRDALARDPFCSSPCARDWYGTSLRSRLDDEREKVQTEPL